MILIVGMYVFGVAAAGAGLTSNFFVTKNQKELHRRYVKLTKARDKVTLEMKVAHTNVLIARTTRCFMVCGLVLMGLGRFWST
ncbi:hypothetical protein [Azohydromonas caseinilytica]|uniref:Uncharacterized protein n=1 Tax=Azohydromonas caseinilytica TaxID=2728836 RepID=A0A848FHP3_9BURK|nr:hypothetical protein [Azohydromonas caseinilytica]NML18666.1 hypothetical protein [Azohydromonas caseinilytica]